MSIRRLGGVLALLGGVAWVVAGLIGTSHSWWTEFRWAGLALVLAGFVCLGLNLLKGKSRWLDVVVGVAFPLLAWTMYEVLADVVSSAKVLHLSLGAVFVAVGGALVARSGDPRDSGASGATPTAPSHRA